MSLDSRRARSARRAVSSSAATGVPDASVSTSSLSVTPRPASGKSASSSDAGPVAGVGQLRDLGAQHRDHRRERARIVFVEHEQVEQRRDLLATLVQRAIGDRAVEQTEHERERAFAFALQHAALEHRVQRARHREQPFDLATDRQQPPAVVARHAVGLRAGDRVELRADVLERVARERSAQLVVAGVLFVVERVEPPRVVLDRRRHEAPVLGRQPVADLARGARQRVEREADAAAVVGHRQSGDQRALEHARRAVARRAARRRDFAGHEARRDAQFADRVEEQRRQASRRPAGDSARGASSRTPYSARSV